MMDSSVTLGAALLRRGSKRLPFMLSRISQIPRFFLFSKYLSYHYVSRYPCFRLILIPPLLTIPPLDVLGHVKRALIFLFLCVAVYFILRSDSQNRNK
jgi:hypothetical protein